MSSRQSGLTGPVSSRGASTFELILNTSTNLFAESGFAATTMRQLAERAGLPLSAFYYYFPSKYEVLRAIMDSGMERLEVALDEAIDPALSPGDQLIALVRAHVLTHLEKPAVARVADGEIRALVDADRESAAARRDAYELRFRRVLTQGVEAGQFDPGLDVRLATMSILTMGTGVIHWWRPGGRLTADEVAEQIGRYALGVAVGAGPVQQA